MRQLFYTVVRHGVMLRTLLVLSVAVAAAMAVVVAPEPVLAWVDAWGP